MATRLLERDSELRVLDAALDGAAGGAGSVVLVSGEAGIGKTSLVRAFTRSLRAGRVLAGACDDLLTPRALGPLRDAARHVRGPLAAALAADDPGGVFPAVLEELADPHGPTVLVVEDVHWADSATLDLLRHVGRRVDDVPALLLLTYRPDEIGREHPLLGVLGSLAGRAVRRLSLGGLSPDAVAELAGGSAVDAQRLHRATAGNPFFVTEALASPDDPVPRTVVDAVLARVHRLSPAARAVVEQLAVVPSRVEPALLRALCPDLVPVTEAERLGVLEVRTDAVAFRHELARRAVEQSLPVTIRFERNARVTAALLDAPTPDRARVLHHCVEAGDDAGVVRHGPSVAREASRAGAHRQAVAAYEQVLARSALLDPAEHAALLDAHAWSLYNVNRLHDAAAAARAAVALADRLGDRALIRYLVTLSRQQWLLRHTAEALADARRADDLAAAPDVATADRATARVNLGAVLVLVDREEEGLSHLDPDGGDAELAVLARNYRGSALLQLGDLGGCAALLDSVAVARELGQHEYVMRGYYNLVEGLWRLGRHTEAARYLDAADEYGRDRDFQAHTYFFTARRQRLLLMRGKWGPAEDVLRSLLAERPDPGMLGRETMPVLARLLVRQGADEAAQMLAAADRAAREADVLEWLVPTGMAHLEHAWLTSAPRAPLSGAAGAWAALLRVRTDRPGAAHLRGELLRWLCRLGEPVTSFPGCPPEFAAGIGGDWRAAAAEWERVGDPYERALELLESGEAEPTLEALTVLDGLGARPAATLARRRLRELGVVQVPRGPAAATRTNPAGLTERQMEILRLLAAGMTNAEIAGRLVVSVRTVDHHVSAVLQKLGVATRREAAAAVATLGLG
ncbi:ATP-binding protein [Pseudonocardia charpentierae]|uniref:AAA family ATPase n=1 Tax=Pseudonocardia charpentierae TaxID=3075545 RepID=A0ABU2N8C8_9PSEU|nr:AAA family ATPase [Pseudonocardia sp. DSM 45834]MDT0350207.1 AAA family ATPase [Pseudonocardia sp. DSM 45834]